MQVLKTLLKVPQRLANPRSFSRLAYSPKFFFSMGDPLPSMSLKPEPPAVPKLDEDIKELSESFEYKEGLRSLIEKKYEIAEGYFRQTMESLDSEEKEFKPKIYAHVMNKLALTLKIQGKDEELTNLFEDIYFITSSEVRSPELTYRALANLFTHYSHINPGRGSVFIETLLEQQKTDPIGINYLKDVNFYIGTLYLIGANYQKAIEHLQECLDLKPHPTIRGMALHNLSCAYWWDYQQLLKEEGEKVQKDFENNVVPDDEALMKDQQFADLLKRIGERNKDVIPHLKNAIKSFELLYGDDPIKFPRPEKDKLTPKEFSVVSLLLEEVPNKVDLKLFKAEEVALKAHFSIFSSMILGERYYQAGAVEEAIFWLKTSLHLSVKSMTMPRTLRTMVVLAFINFEQKQYEFAEKLMLDCLEYMEGMNVYNKIFCLETYAFMLRTLKRNYEADEYQRQANKLRIDIPEWYHRRELVQIPEYYL